MIRQILGYVLLSALLIGAVICFYFGIEILLSGIGTPVAWYLLVGGGFFGGLAAVMLAEDVSGWLNKRRTAEPSTVTAADFLALPKSGPRALPPDKANSTRVALPPDRP